MFLSVYICASAGERGHLDDGVEVVVAELREVLAVRGAVQVALQQLAVEVEPGRGHEPRHGRAARVVGQQRRLRARHHQRAQLHAARAHALHLSYYIIV